MQRFEKEKDLFETLGLEVNHRDAEKEIEVGETYPIFGMITDIGELNEGVVEIEINRNIKATLFVSEVEKLDLLKQRAFESAIFVSKVIAKTTPMLVECKTVIFGKPQGPEAIC